MKHIKNTNRCPILFKWVNKKLDGNFVYQIKKEKMRKTKQNIPLDKIMTIIKKILLRIVRDIIAHTVI